MERVFVTSTDLQSIGYEPESQTLEIEFMKGSVYQYFEVPQGEYEALLYSDSKGKHFGAHIKGRYAYAKL